MEGSSLLDDLYCQEEEERWYDNDEGSIQAESGVYSEHIDGNMKLFPSLLILLKQDLLWDDDELVSILSKEQEQKKTCDEAVKNSAKKTTLSAFMARREAVDWMLKVSTHYGFTILTSVLAINYLDRFLSSVYYQKDKPWMIQLVAVTCLSLAAKVEETQVPLLLDLQVGDAKYVFEAKTIQRMELLLLSALKWKMHPVTPLSFLDHIIRRLAFTSHTHWKFFQQCERLILAVVADSRFIGYLPSVMATATMMSVIDQMDPFNAPEYQDQLLGIIKISKEQVNECYGLILELQKSQNSDYKRKYDLVDSPNGVNDVFFSCDENSNDSWAEGYTTSLSSSAQPLLKKSRTQDKNMRLPSLSSRGFVDIVSSPR